MPLSPLVLTLVLDGLFLVVPVSGLQACTQFPRRQTVLEMFLPKVHSRTSHIHFTLLPLSLQPPCSCSLNIYSVQALVTAQHPLQYFFPLLFFILYC